MVYGYLTKNYFPLFSCFLYGECCAILFLSVYCYYSADKCYVIRVVAVVLTIVTIVTIYAIASSLGYTGQSTSSVSTIMGLIAVVEAFVCTAHLCSTCSNTRRPSSSTCTW